jgi:glycosyltransferase involved in cell wall biosynthesis
MNAYEGPLQRIHVFGHPVHPLDVSHRPADAQVFNCLNFCSLLHHAGLPYTYYGMSGSVLPRDGEFVDLGTATGDWVYGNEWHQEYTRRASAAFLARIGDPEVLRPELVAMLYGAAQMDIAFGELPVVEAMVGYDHCCDTYRVFPSYAHQAALYARQQELIHDTKFFDTVIPHFLDPDHYPAGTGQGGYALYLGRNAPDKGIALAEAACEAAGLPLRKVHDGVWGEEKAKLLGDAQVVMMPTLYLEPFGYVAIEAQMCGTPVVTTDWGAFPETVDHGETGFRCRTHAEFLAALEKVGGLDRQLIRRRAVARFGVETVAPRYLAYFNFVWRVHNGGYSAPGALR